MVLDAFKSYPVDSEETIEDVPETEEVSDTVSRLLRGGSFYNPSSIVRSALRNYYRPVTRYNYFGFRLARTYR